MVLGSLHIFLKMSQIYYSNLWLNSCTFRCSFLLLVIVRYNQSDGVVSSHMYYLCHVSYPWSPPIIPDIVSLCSRIKPDIQMDLLHDMHYLCCFISSSLSVIKPHMQMLYAPFTHPVPHIIKAGIKTGLQMFHLIKSSSSV